MKLIELSKYLNDEEEAEEYLLKNGILKLWTNCFHCNSDKIGKMSRGRIKCYKCKKEWNKRRGSILEGRHISSAIFLGIIKLYSDGFGVTRICTELNLDRKTILKIVSQLRSLIICHTVLEQLKEVLEFSIIQDSSQKINVRFPSIHASSSNEKVAAIVKIKKVRLPDKSFSCKSTLVWQNLEIAAEWNQIHRFANYLHSQLINYRGLSSRSFNEYLLELIERFNNEETNFFDLLIEKLQISKGG